MKTLQVSQFESKNQFVITDKHGLETLQSYSSIIAQQKKGFIIIDPNYCFYSHTTSKYFNLWIGRNNADAVKQHINKYKGFKKIPDLVLTWNTFKFKSLN